MQLSSSSWNALLVTLAIFLARSAAEQIDGNVVLNGDKIYPEAVAITLGSRLTLVDNSLASISGKFVNDGVFILTWGADHIPRHSDGFRGAVLNIWSRDFVNNHHFVFDHSTARTKSIVSIDSDGEIKNLGNMWFAFSGQPKGSPVHTVAGPQRSRTHLRVNADNFLNTGKIMVSSKDHRIEALMKLDAKETGVFINDGALCLKNTNFFLQSQLRGNGCIYVGPNAVLDLCGVEWNLEQTFYLDSIGAIREGEPQIKFCPSKKPKPPLRLRGLRESTQLNIADLREFHFENDILRLDVSDGNSILIDVGPGYDIDLFIIGGSEKPDYTGRVWYEGHVDASVPAICQCQFDYTTVIGLA